MDNNITKFPLNQTLSIKTHNIKKPIKAKVIIIFIKLSLQPNQLLLINSNKNSRITKDKKNLKLEKQKNTKKYQTKNNNTNKELNHQLSCNKSQTKSKINTYKKSKTNTTLKKCNLKYESLSNEEKKITRNKYTNHEGQEKKLKNNRNSKKNSQNWNKTFASSMTSLKFSYHRQKSVSKMNISKNEMDNYSQKNNNINSKNKKKVQSNNIILMKIHKISKNNFEKFIEKVKFIQIWWKTIFLIIKIEKIFRGYIYRKKLINILSNKEKYIDKVIYLVKQIKRIYFVKYLKILQNINRRSINNYKNNKKYFPKISKNNLTYSTISIQTHKHSAKRKIHISSSQIIINQNIKINKDNLSTTNKKNIINKIKNNIIKKDAKKAEQINKNDNNISTKSSTIKIDNFNTKNNGKKEYIKINYNDKFKPRNSTIKVNNERRSKQHSYNKYKSKTPKNNLASYKTNNARFSNLIIQPNNKIYNNQRNQRIKIYENKLSHNYLARKIINNDLYKPYKESILEESQLLIFSDNSITNQKSVSIFKKNSEILYNFFVKIIIIILVNKLKHFAEKYILLKYFHLYHDIIYRKVIIDLILKKKKDKETIKEKNRRKIIQFRYSANTVNNNNLNSSKNIQDKEINNIGYYEKKSTELNIHKLCDMPKIDNKNNNNNNLRHSLSLVHYPTYKSLNNFVDTIEHIRDYTVQKNQLLMVLNLIDKHKKQNNYKIVRRFFKKWKKFIEDILKNKTINKTIDEGFSTESYSKSENRKINLPNQNVYKKKKIYDLTRQKISLIKKNRSPNIYKCKYKNSEENQLSDCKKANQIEELEITCNKIVSNKLKIKNEDLEINKYVNNSNSIKKKTRIDNYSDLVKKEIIFEDIEEYNDNDDNIKIVKNFKDEFNNISKQEQYNTINFFANKIEYNIIYEKSLNKSI